VANVLKEFITIHYIESQDNNNFKFFPKFWDAVLLGYWVNDSTVDYLYIAIFVCQIWD